MLANARAATVAHTVIEHAKALLSPRDSDASQRFSAPPVHIAAASVASTIEVDAVTTRAGFDALESDWNDLFARAGRSIHVFQTFNWCWHWCNHFLGPDTAANSARLFVVTARRAGRLVLVWPLVATRTAGLVRLSFLGEPVTQYGDALVDQVDDKAALLDAAWAFIVARSGADAFHFRRVRADADIAPLLVAKQADISERLQAPFLDLTSAPDFATYEQRYSTKARKNRRRLLRRFEERAPATLETLTSGTRARELAELALLLKRAWLKDRGLVSPALADPRTRAFFASVAEAREHPAGCRVTSLETRGEATAIEIAFDCKGRRAVHVIVFALKYERASPGQLLIDRSVRNCFDSGVQVYDLMTPADAYKLDWADDSTEVCDWTLGLTSKGRLYTRLYLARLRPLLKKAINGTTQRLRALRSSNAQQQPTDAG